MASKRAQWYAREYTSFGAMLAVYMQRNELSQRAFAKLAKKSQAFVSQMVRGKGAFPAELIAPWAILLGVSGPEEWDRFWLLALLTRSPPEVRTHVARLEENIRRMKRREAARLAGGEGD